MTKGLQHHADAGTAHAVLHERAQPVVASADAGTSRLPADAAALISSALAATAAHTALETYAKLDPALLIGGAISIFGALMGAHFLLAPAATRRISEPRRVVSRPADGGVDVVAAMPIAQRKTNREPEPQTPKALQEIDQLQRMVSELARATPGPRASSPDPDRLPATDAGVTEQSRAAQTQALERAARLMQRVDRATPQLPESALASELADALAEERLTVYLEPIQQMAHERPRHYEISVRFQSAAGKDLPHNELMHAARTAGLLTKIDAALVPRAARIAQHFQLRGRDTDIFAKVHASSLPDPGFRSEMTAAAIAADGAAPVLSFAQTDIRGFGRIHWDILAKLEDIGVRFAVESVTDLEMDFEALRRRGFLFVKLDADVLLNGLPAPHGIISPTDVCRYFGTLGLALVVGHIDDDETRARVLGFGVLFGQGTLFGGKRAVRSDLLTRKPGAA